MIYVDWLFSTEPSRIWPYTKACHLFSDDNKEELVKFAVEELKLKEEWFQERRTLPHFDLTPNKRKQAIQKGAIEISRDKFLEVMKYWRTKAPSHS